MRIALIALLAACETVPAHSAEEPGPPGPNHIVEPVPAPAPRPSPRELPRKSVSRDVLTEPGIPPLPPRALFVETMGIGATSRILIDVDTRKLSRTVWLALEKPPADITKTLSQAEIDRLWLFAEQSWRSANPPKFSPATDFRQLIIAVDHDEVLYIDVDGSIDATEPSLSLADGVMTASGVTTYW